MPRTPGSLGSGLTADQVAVRRHNLAVVMQHLRLHGARSRARVAAETGLNKATVSSLVAELVERGLVTEGEQERGSVGRPGLVMELDATTYVAVGAEMNIDYISVLAMNLRGESVAEVRTPLDTANMSPEQVLQRTAAAISSLMDPLLASGSRPVGLTLAVPGIVETATGVVFEAPNLGWRETSVVDPIRDLLGDPDFPILLDNEANLAALAELEVRGAGAAQEQLLLTGAVGVGGGIVTGGQLLRGARGFAGEIGHLQVDRHGQVCRCGRRGCWETVIGLNALLGLAVGPGDPVRDPSVDVVRRLEELRARAEADDERTLAAIHEVGDWLALGCGSLINIFNPEVIVLGGYFAVLGPWFAARLADDLQHQVFAPEAGGCRVELSTLGFSAAVRGGALRATQAVLENPTLAPVRTADPLDVRRPVMTQAASHEAPQAGPAAALLEMKGIVKEFPGVRALGGVDLDVRAGEVHCLLGQNGAGKSTLIKVLSASYQPDAGTIVWDGEETRLTHPMDSIRAGIATIYQELDLVQDLTVAENIFLGHEKSRARLHPAPPRQPGGPRPAGQARSPRDRAHPAGGRPLARRAADRQHGARPLPRHPPADPRRAVGRPRRRGGQEPLPGDPGPDGRGGRRGLHLPPARGDPRDRRPDHRPQGRHHRGHRAARRGDPHPAAHRADDRPLHRVRLPAASRGQDGERPRRRTTSCWRSPGSASPGCSATSASASTPARSSA